VEKVGGTNRGVHPLGGAGAPNCYHRGVPERDLDALESYQLLPKLLHDVGDADTTLHLLGESLGAPILPLVEEGGVVSTPFPTLCLQGAEWLLNQSESFSMSAALPLLKPDKMGALMPKVRKLAARGAPGFVLDLTALAETPPFGSHAWRPRTREDLAELRAAAGVPLWLYGVCSVPDAEVASEAGVDGIVVNTGAGVFLGAPGTAEVFPDIFDAVAGTISVYAGGAVRSGVDVFRYLALGAEAVVVDTDRSLENLRAELAYAMRLTGCRTLADISYEAIFAPLFSEL